MNKDSLSLKNLQEISSTEALILLLMSIDKYYNNEKLIKRAFINKEENLIVIKAEIDI